MGLEGANVVRVGERIAEKVVAQRAGFGTQSYMNAVFQAKVGKTPGSFRRAGHTES